MRWQECNPNLAFLDGVLVGLFNLRPLTEELSKRNSAAFYGMLTIAETLLPCASPMRAD